MPESLTIAILAAGASRRLGQPKQLVIINGKPLLRRQCEVALKADIGPVSVILGSNAEACRAAISGLPVSIHLNANWADGLGSSIACAAKAVLFPPPVPRGRVREGVFPCESSDAKSPGKRTPPPQPSPGIPVEGEACHGLLLLHCDQFAISAGDLRSLYKIWDADRSKAVRSRSGSYLGPPVIFPASSFGDLKQLTGDDGAKSVIARLGRSNVVEVEIPSAVEDLDTPEQLARLH